MKCNLCKTDLPVGRFTPSSVRDGRATCKPCHYRVYVKPRRERDGVYGRIARALEQRERRRLGVGVTVSAAAVKAKLETVIFICDVTKRQLPPEELELVRANEALPFHIDTNCQVVSRAQVMRRKHLLKHLPPLPPLEDIA